MNTKLLPSSGGSYINRDGRLEPTQAPTKPPLAPCTRRDKRKTFTATATTATNTTKESKVKTHE
ncbi:MAG: hypothetical protein LBE32_00510 [Burkholderiales bacterium]|jgi:hypothetical protein|nr:hypothetical protein [Burkholderiales bacterium]